APTGIVPSETVTVTRPTPTLPLVTVPATVFGHWNISFASVSGGPWPASVPPMTKIWVPTIPLPASPLAVGIGGRSIHSFSDGRYASLAFDAPAPLASPITNIGSFPHAMPDIA